MIKNKIYPNKLVSWLVLVLLIGQSLPAEAAMRRLSGLDFQRFVPAQSSQTISPRDRLWSCGPNSGARSLAMLPEGICVRLQKDDQAFLVETPATIGRQLTSFIHYAQTSLFVVLAGSPLLAFGPTKATLAWSSLVAAGIASPWWLQAVAPVGPHPAALASYMQQHLTSYKVSDLYFDKFEQALQVIKDSIEGDMPVIAHFCYGPFALHYANIVGIDATTEEVEVLETNGERYRMTFENLHRYMNTKVPVLNPILFSNYNLITFRPMSGVDF